MSARPRSRAVLAVLLIALVALPGMASARPADDSVVPRNQMIGEPSTPAPTVVRTVVREEAVRELPLVLAGAALLVALAGTGSTLVRRAPLRRPLH